MIGNEQTLPRTVYLIGYRPREFQIWVEACWLIADEGKFEDPRGALNDLRSRLKCLVEVESALEGNVSSDAKELVDLAHEFERQLTVEWTSEERKRLLEQCKANQQRDPEFEEDIEWQSPFGIGLWPRFLTQLDEFGARLPKPLPLCYRAGCLMSEALRRIDLQSMQNPYRFSIAEFEQLLVEIYAEFPELGVSHESLSLEAFWQSAHLADSFYSVWLRDRLTAVHQTLTEQTVWRGSQDREKSPEGDMPPSDVWIRLAIDVKSGRIEFDGVVYRVDNVFAAFLSELHKARGAARTRPELADANPLLEGFRWDRQKNRDDLPDELTSLVRAQRGKGSWIEFPSESCRSPAE